MEGKVNLKRKVSERRLVDVLVSYLSAHSAVKRAVRHYEKTIDVAALCLQSGELWAIEAKTEDWRNAMKQAIVNLAAAERSYIAIYSEFVHRVSSEELDNNGIGLISVGTSWGDVDMIKEAHRSPFVNSIMNERIKKELLQEGVR